MGTHNTPFNLRINFLRTHNTIFILRINILRTHNTIFNLGNTPFCINLLKFAYICINLHDKWPIRPILNRGKFCSCFSQWKPSSFYDQSLWVEHEYSTSLQVDMRQLDLNRESHCEKGFSFYSPFVSSLNGHWTVKRMVNVRTFPQIVLRGWIFTCGWRDGRLIAQTPGLRSSCSDYWGRGK